MKGVIGYHKKHCKWIPPQIFSTNIINVRNLDSIIGLYFIIQLNFYPNKKSCVKNKGTTETLYHASCNISLFHLRIGYM